MLAISRVMESLPLFARQELEPIELLGLVGAQLAHEALDAVVGAVEPVLVDQVLPDRHGVASPAQLLLDERPVRLARRHRAGGRRRRWPGWRNLLRQAGGHPGGICPLGGQALLVRADRLAVDPRDPLDLSLARPALQERAQGRLQMRLQGVHSNPPSREGAKVTPCPVPPRQPDESVSPSRHSAQVEEFGWPQVGEFGWPSGGSSTQTSRGPPAVRSTNQPGNTMT